MKTIIITIAGALLLSIGNIFGSDNLYKNVVGNKELGVVSSTVYHGSKKGSLTLTPCTQNVFCYDSNKSLKERISYKWNSETNKWIAIGRHTFEYNADGKLTNVAYSEWNKTIKSWSTDVKYAMYIYDENNEDSPVKYLTVTNVEAQIK